MFLLHSFLKNDQFHAFFNIWTLLAFLDAIPSTKLFSKDVSDAVSGKWWEKPSADNEQTNTKGF